MFYFLEELYELKKKKTKIFTGYHNLAREPNLDLSGSCQQTRREPDGRRAQPIMGKALAVLLALYRKRLPCPKLFRYKGIEEIQRMIQLALSYLSDSTARHGESVVPELCSQLC